MSICIVPKDPNQPTLTLSTHNFMNILLMCDLFGWRPIGTIEDREFFDTDPANAANPPNLEMIYATSDGREVLKSDAQRMTRALQRVRALIRRVQCGFTIGAAATESAVAAELEKCLPWSDPERSDKIEWAADRVREWSNEDAIAVLDEFQRATENGFYMY